MGDNTLVQAPSVAHHHHHQNQQQQQRSELQTQQLNHLQPTRSPSIQAPQLTTQAQQLILPNAATSASTNQLVVNIQHLMPRKSVIGSRLERSSFQAQRLSDVGIAVSQQITANMGFKLPASQERVVEQTRWLYLRFIYAKLRQHSLPLRDLNLTKASRNRHTGLMGSDTLPKSSISAPASASIATSKSSSNIFNEKFKRKRTVLADDIGLADLPGKVAAIDASPNGTIPVESIISSASLTSGAAIGGASIDNQRQSHSTRKFVMDPAINNQIFAVILNIVKELRDLKPELYGDTIYELIGIDKFSSIESLLELQVTICQEMTRSEITWHRITALFSLFAAMSLDCVRLGSPEHVGPLMIGFIEFVERDLAFWISQQGGWEAFLYKFRSASTLRHQPLKVAMLALPILTWLLVAAFR